MKKLVGNFIKVAFVLICTDKTQGMNLPYPYDNVLMSQLQHTFQKPTPFYAISVSRKTANDQDYPKLSEHEQNIVFQAISFFSGQSNEFQKTLDVLVKQKIEQDSHFLHIFQQSYPEAVKILNNQTVDPDITFLTTYLNEKKDFDYLFSKISLGELIGSSQNINDFRKKIEIYVQDNQEFVQGLIPHNYKSVYLDESGQQPKLKVEKNKIVFLTRVIDFIGNTKINNFLKEKVAKISKIDLEKFLQLQREHIADPNFQRRHNHKVEIFRYLTTIQHHMAHANYLIVFNEMFFGKSEPEKPTFKTEAYAPFLVEEFQTISQKIELLSKEIPSAIFHVNFLYEEAEKIDGKKYKENLRRYINNKSFATQGRQVLFDESAISLEKMLASIDDDKGYQPFKNESLIYANGRVVSSYQKASYKDEANKILRALIEGKDSKVYVLGSGVDEKKDRSPLGDFVNKMVSNQICYDLEIGVRKNLETYPVDGKIHIVVSNTLPLSLDNMHDLLTKDRFNYLPESIPLIFHVDPNEQDMFLNPPKRYLSLNDFQIKKPENISHFVPHEPIYKRPFEIELGGSIFTFKFWDINAAFEKLQKY